MKEKGTVVPQTQDDNGRAQYVAGNSKGRDISLTSEAKEHDLTDVDVDGVVEKKLIQMQVVPDEVALDSLGLEVSPHSLIEASDGNKKALALVVDVQSKEHAAFRSKKWLMDQSKPAYLAQVLGSYSEETAQKFIQKIGKQKFEVYYLETEHKGKPWFVVFYGVFPAKAHAQDAVKNAPKLFRSQNPWIRSSADVLASYPK